MHELFVIPPSKPVHITHDCRKKSTVVLHPSVATGWMVGRCGGCGKSVAIKGGVNEGSEA